MFMTWYSISVGVFFQFGLDCVEAWLKSALGNRRLGGVGCRAQRERDERGDERETEPAHQRLPRQGAVRVSVYAGGGHTPVVCIHMGTYICIP